MGLDEILIDEIEEVDEAEILDDIIHPDEIDADEYHDYSDVVDEFDEIGLNVEDDDDLMDELE